MIGRFHFSVSSFSLTYILINKSRFLILGYPAGLQIWDCSDLNAISEILNLNFDSAEWRMILGSGKGGSANSQEEGAVVYAALLPSPSETRTDPFSGDRPLLGILCVLFYSLFNCVCSKFFKDANDSY